MVRFPLLIARHSFLCFFKFKQTSINFWSWWWWWISGKRDSKRLKFQKDQIYTVMDFEWAFLIIILPGLRLKFRG